MVYTYTSYQSLAPRPFYTLPTVHTLRFRRVASTAGTSGGFLALQLSCTLQRTTSTLVPAPLKKGWRHIQI